MRGVEELYEVRSIQEWTEDASLGYISPQSQEGEQTALNYFLKTIGWVGHQD